MKPATHVGTLRWTAEAASVGKPVLLLPMAGRGDPKFRRLHESLQVRGAARPFAGRLETWPCEPLGETERAAAEIVRRLAAAGIAA